MSLLSDPDYLIHNIRLAYLRHVDDPYGPRILSLNPGYTSNAHILASGLADQELWPEIVMPSTPGPVEQTLSKDPNKRHSGFPGATGLKYSQTIVGQTRTGVLGMRVNGKRASLIREPVSTAEALENIGVRHRSDSEPTPVPTTPGNLDPGPEKPITSVLLRRRSADASELEEAPIPSAPTEVEPFKPPFARAAEMEARRKIRMRSRLASAGDVQRPVVTLSTEFPNPEVSEDEMSGEDDLEIIGNDIRLEGDDAVEDEFSDPENEFGPRIVLGTSESDGMLSVSNSALSMSHSSGAGPYGGSSHLNVRSTSRGRLSPVHEVHPNQHQKPSEVGSENPPLPRQGSEQFDTSVIPQRICKSDGSYFEPVVPPTPGRSQTNGSSNASNSQELVRDPTLSNPIIAPAVTFNASATPAALHIRQPSTLTFTRVPVPPLPARSPLSALSQMLKTHNTDNPFSELYSLISSRSDPLSLEVFYPFSAKPMMPVTLKVRSDATVEEVIGFALWTYWEEGFLPKLDQGLDGLDDLKRKDKLSAAGWSLRITEDGEVDDDFPAMDRMAKMSKFNFEGYAILPETPAQAEQNRAAVSKIVRRPSRVMIAKKKATESQNLALPGPNASGATSGSLVSLAPVSSSIGGGSTISQGPQQFLRVKVAEKADVHYSTTIPVKESMYMEEVLENVCRKRKINDPKQWCLVYDLYSLKIFVPLDRTVASLQGKAELYLVKETNLAQYGIRRQQTRSTDPNASIFSRISEVPEQQYSAALDITSAYKKYTVYRKMPMLVVRHERTLAMDGDYIHIMPSATRAFLDSMKTSSYHIKTVIACIQSAKSSSNFKLVVWRDGGNKRYDFEAESPKVAAEIVRNIRELRTKRLERSGTLNRSRRSRHVG